MTRIKLDARRLVGSLALFGLVGCGATMPPRELVNARSAYQRAQSGPAAELAPAQLDTAMQSLRQAEDAFRDDGDTQETVDLAYIARRRAEEAEAYAAIEGSKRQQEAADKEYKRVSADLTDEARAELEATRARLRDEQSRLERERELAARDRTDAERRLSEAAEKVSAAEQAKKYMEEQAAAAQAELKKSKEQLEAERNARLAAEKKLQAALASLEKIAQVKEEKRGVVITLSGSVLFATGKSELLPIAQSKLTEVAAALKDQGYKKIVVEGHTDSRGQRAMNMNLSLARAQSVRNYLISQGIAVDKISAIGLGPDRPVADNGTADGRANNRRVELVLTPE